MGGERNTGIEPASQAWEALALPTEPYRQVSFSGCKSTHFILYVQIFRSLFSLEVRFSSYVWLVERIFWLAESYASFTETCFLKIKLDVQMYVKKIVATMRIIT